MFYYLLWLFVVRSLLLVVYAITKINRSHVKQWKLTPRENHCVPMRSVSVCQFVALPNRHYLFNGIECLKKKFKMLLLDLNSTANHTRIVYAHIFTFYFVFFALNIVILRLYMQRLITAYEFTRNLRKKFCDFYVIG